MEGDDPMTVDLLASDELTLNEMAAHLGVASEKVLRRERAGDLLSYFKQRRGDERLYPIYQLAPEVQPGMVRRARAVLDQDVVLVHFFFTQRDPDLAHLSVREVLAGRVVDGFELDDDAAWLLSQPLPRRMEVVMGALARVSAVSQGW
jgi:hypothetical protein